MPDTENNPELTREIHFLSDSELSKLIGDKLFPWDESRCRICGWPLKPSIDEGCTVEVCTMVHDRPQKRADEHADFVHDAQMTVMLLENIARLPGRKVEIESDKFGDRIEWTVAPYCTSQRLGRAVAEAFMLAHGYKAT